MRKNQHITAFYLETLLLIVVFLAIILVLTNVFGLARAESGEARQLTAAVNLAENAAEAVSAADSPSAVVELLDEDGNVRLTENYIEAGYHSDMSPDNTRAADLWVKITWEPSAENERLVRSEIRVFCGNNVEPIYTLDTAAFLREVAS